MKKNILAVIILALSVINLILGAILIFTVVPMANKTSALVTKVASTIDLELESQGVQQVDIKDRESVPIEQEASAMVNLISGDDGKQHMALFDSITLSVNKKSKDYKKLKPQIETNTQKIQSIVQNVISTYSYDQVATTEGKEKVIKDILKELQSYFNSEDFIVDVVLANFRYQ